LLTVLDAETKQPLDALVRMRGVDNTVVGALKSTIGVSEFIIMSPIPKNYIVYVELDGYIFENIEISLGGATEVGTTDEKVILLRKIKTGEISVLRHVFFDTGKATLQPESYDELDKFLRMMEQNMKVRIEIGGHTDNVGTHEYNIELSQKRAATVRNYLTSKGIEAKRVTAVGYGETKPIVSNDDEEGGRAINRRVEFKVLQN
jgi:outer membrane protein OmpA-like peptidoglycan-associated protein